MADFDLSKITGREPPLVTDDERDAEIAYLSDVVANRDRELAALRARVATLEAANTGLATEAQRLKAGLRFYARGLHFSPGNDRDWEDVSGEPPNFLCDEHGNTIEDGTIAKCVLLNQDCGEGWEGDDWPPDELPEETSASAPPVHRLHCFDCALEAEMPEVGRGDGTVSLKNVQGWTMVGGVWRCPMCSAPRQGSGRDD